MPKEFFISDKSEKLTFFKSLVNDPLIRKEHQLCLVFGKKTVQELSCIKAIITTSDHKDDPFFQSSDRYVLSESAFKKLSGLVTPEPYAALVELPTFPFPHKISQGILILDELNDPGNVGTLFRTAWGLGLEGIILLTNSVDPYHSKVLRASKATTLKMPWMKMERNEVLSYLHSSDLTVYCADLAGEKLHSITPVYPFALILGNEARGVCDELKTLGTAIHIPQTDLDSYNVAIAGAIISYTLMNKELL